VELSEQLFGHRLVGNHAVLVEVIVCAKDELTFVFNLYVN